MNPSESDELLDEPFGEHSATWDAADHHDGRQSAQGAGRSVQRGRLVAADVHHERRQTEAKLKL